MMKKMNKIWVGWVGSGVVEGVVCRGQWSVEGSGV